MVKTLRMYPPELGELGRQAWASRAPAPTWGENVFFYLFIESPSGVKLLCAID